MDKRFGIRGKLLRLIINLYSNTTGQAVVNELYTQEFPIFSGVLQGSVLGPTLFLLFLDDLLEKLHESMLGIPMKIFVLSVLAYADDITLLSLETNKLQGLLDICYSWAKKNGMSFGLDKCFAVVFNSRTKKAKALPTFIFGRSPLNTFYPEDAPKPYLGVNITDHVAKTKIDSNNTLAHSIVPNYRRKPNSKYLKLIKLKFIRARHGACQLCTNKAMLNPSISIRLYKAIQRSTLLYAIEIADWDVDQVNELEVLQAKALRTCLNSDLQCPQSLIRLFSGVEPLEARRDLHILLYYGKLCRYKRMSFTSMVHRFCTSGQSKPVGFHCTVIRILRKYGLQFYWNNIPDVPDDKLKEIFKKPIWLHHWRIDVASASRRDSPFSNIFLKDVIAPIYPYKTMHLLKIFNTHEIPVPELASVLRFWMTPSRKRFCSCTIPTSNLAKHLIFACPKTRDHVAFYSRKLLPNLRTLFNPETFYLFLSRISCSYMDFISFNRVVGKFDYPRF